jgi:hypothetical protein
LLEGDGALGVLGEGVLGDGASGVEVLVEVGVDSGLVAERVSALMVPTVLENLDLTALVVGDLATDGVGVVDGDDLAQTGLGIVSGVEGGLLLVDLHDLSLLL